MDAPVAGALYVFKVISDNASSNLLLTAEGKSALGAHVARHAAATLILLADVLRGS